MTVRELLARIDSHELTEWMAFHNLRPFGEEQSDIRAGIVASTVANCSTVNGGFKPSDFIPQYGESRGPQSDADIKDMAVKITAMLGGSMR